jgi:hypothetical protein
MLFVLGDSSWVLKYKLYTKVAEDDRAINDDGFDAEPYMVDCEYDFVDLLSSHNYSHFFSSIIGMFQAAGA